ncbi:hypothetical protein PPS11_02473 [Pseudomonas putida S11]|nr:hypothetical protein PPS11_02473 [Pseudomonas putida S11]
MFVHQNSNRRMKKPFTSTATAQKQPCWPTHAVHKQHLTRAVERDPADLPSLPEHSMPELNISKLHSDPHPLPHGIMQANPRPIYYIDAREPGHSQNRLRQ